MKEKKKLLLKIIKNSGCTSISCDKCMYYAWVDTKDCFICTACREGYNEDICDDPSAHCHRGKCKTIRLIAIKDYAKEFGSEDILELLI